MERNAFDLLLYHLFQNFFFMSTKDRLKEQQRFGETALLKDQVRRSARDPWLPDGTAFLCSVLFRYSFARSPYTQSL